jgi:polysaccharide pyruvyl transferase WcaK-like protein
MTATTDRAESPQVARRAAGRGSRRPRVVLLGHFGAGNLGNDASLAAVADMLRRVVPDVELVAVCRKPEVVRRDDLDARWIHAPRPPGGRLPAGRLRRLAMLPYRLADLRHAARTVGEADLVVVPGTGILDDFGGSRSYGWPAVLLTWFTAARLRRVPVAMIGVGAGPLARPSTRRAARAIAALTTHQSYRDPGSRSFMLDLGVSPERSGLAADVVFRGPWQQRSAPPAAATTGDRQLAVVAVMDYGGWQRTALSGDIHARYLADLTRFVCWLLERGYRVRLLTADQTGDDDATQRLAALIRSAEPELAAEALTTAAAADFTDAVLLTGDARFVVATRYHSVVAALLNCVPVLSLGYARKNDELLARVGLADFAQDVEHAEPDRLRQQVLRVERERPELAARVRAGLAEMRQTLAAEEDVLAALVARNHRGAQRLRSNR